MGDKSKYVEGGGVWGRSGVVKPSLEGAPYVLFCIIKNQTNHNKGQNLNSYGVFTWVSQPSMFPGERKLERLVRSKNVLLFAKPGPGPNYTYLGNLEFISVDDTLYRPTLVRWKVDPWPFPDSIKGKFEQRS